MTDARDARWDLVEELVFQCLELQEQGSGHARIVELLDRQPADVAAEVRRVLTDVHSWREPNPSSSAFDLRLPERLGTYRLGRRLGQGGMGAVYEAVDESLGRRVALKVVRPDLLALGGARQRFRREVEAVARLSHQGIVQVYQVGEDDGVPWFAMELLQGSALAETIQALRGDARDPADLRGEDLLPSSSVGADADAGGRESASGGSTQLAGSWERACVRIVRQVADALAHAHSKGILHRDVKPSNIVLDPNGNARLLDFGLAHAEGSAELTRSGAILGSLPYVPPEQVRGDVREPDVRADIYSLGVTLYELLSLCSPFLSDVESRTRRNIEAGNAQPLRHLHRGLSWEIAAVTAVAMDREPARRYQSMAEFAADLQRVLDRRPIVARPPGLLLRVRRMAERHPAVATGLVGTLLAAVLIVLVYAVGLRNERDRALGAQQEAERLRELDRERSYFAGVQAASLAIRLGQGETARRHLTRCPEELRQFEWHYLMAKVDESVAAQRVGDGYLRRVVSTERGLFVAGAEGVLSHVDLGTLAVHALAPATAPIYGLDATIDGSIVVSSHGDHHVRIWDADEATMRAEIPLSRLYEGRREIESKYENSFAVAIERDGDMAYATSVGGAVARIDAAKGQLVGGFLLAPPKGGVFAIAVSPGGDMLAVGYDHEVLLLSPEGDLKRRLRGHSGFIFSLQFSSDGAYLLSAGQDRTARVWRIGDGAAGTVFFGHEGELHDATFAPDGTVWTASTDGTLRSWHVGTGHERMRRLGHEGAVYGVTLGMLSGETFVVTVGWDGTVRKWGASSGRARSRIAGPGRLVLQPLFVHGQGTRCTMIDTANGVRTFELPSGRPVDAIVSGEAEGIAVHGDVVAVAHQGRVRRQGDDRALSGLVGDARRIVFCEDGTLVAAEVDGAFVFWPPGSVVGDRREAHEGEVAVMLPLPDGGLLSAGQDGRVCVWSENAVRELALPEAHAGSWAAAALSPDGKVAYLCGHKLLLALEVASAKVRWHRQVAGGYRSIATAAQGRRLLVAGADRAMHVHDSRDGAEVLALPSTSVLHAVVAVDDVAVSMTSYSEVDLWTAR